MSSKNANLDSPFDPSIAATFSPESESANPHFAERLSAHRGALPKFLNPNTAMSVKPTMQPRLSPVLLGTVLSLSMLGTACRSTPGANAASPATLVKLETLQPDTIKDRSEFIGNLEAVQIVEILPETQGRIEQILVEPGEEVAAGQTLIVLKPDQAAPEYAAALAAVEVAMGDRENALKQIEIAKAKRNTASAQFEIESSYVPRLQRLFDQGAIEQFRLDELLQKVEAAKNNLIAAEQEVAAAEVKLEQSENTVRQTQAQADASLVNVQSKNIVTPIAGVVDNLPVKLGDYVSTSAGAPVAQVAQTEALFLNIAVPAKRSAQLTSALSVELIDPASKALLASGSLTFVSPTVNPEGQTILTKARFRNVDGKLRHGQNVQARIIWETQPGLLIPTTAISRVGGRSFVFLVDDPSDESEPAVVRLTPVELGDIQGDSYQVLSGLEAGDRIAISNILKLRDGAPIAPESASTL